MDVASSIHHRQSSLSEWAGGKSGQKVDGVVQLAALRMFAVDVPTSLALEVAARRVECAENALASIPADFITAFGQCAIVADLTGLWGLRTWDNELNPIPKVGPVSQV